MVLVEGWEKKIICLLRGWELHEYRVISVTFCFVCFVNCYTSRAQESADQRQEGPQFSLANKFTSENTSSVQAQTEPLVPVGGVDPASRPAGLSFPTPIASGNSATSPSPAASAASMGGLDLGEKPVRSTFAWRPAPLLCKRLNVPVPKDDMAPMGGPHTGGASSASDQGLLGPLGKFVPDSSAVQPKVCDYIRFGRR